MAKKNKNTAESQSITDSRIISIQMPEDIYSKIRVLAFVTDTSVSQVIRDLVSENLDKKITRNKEDILDFLGSFKNIE